MYRLRGAGKDFKKDLDNISKHFQNFCRKYDVSVAEAMTLLGQSRGKDNNSGTYVSEKTVPLEIFLVDDLGYSESLVRYLKDCRGIPIKTQSELLNRSPGGLWASYYSSEKKFPSEFDDSMMQRLSERLSDRLSSVRPDLVQKKDSFRVPIDLISGRNLSPFQSVVMFMRTYFGMRFSEISIVLGKDMHSVWNAARSARSVKQDISGISDAGSVPDEEQDMAENRIEDEYKKR